MAKKNWKLKFDELIEKIKDWFDSTAPELPTPPSTPTPPVVVPPTVPPVVVPPVVQPTNPELPIDDMVDYKLIRWFGSPSCPSAKQCGAKIKNLKVSGDKMSYVWEKGGCENMGAGNAKDYSKTMACMGYKKHGTWYMAKFDWISTSRLTRSFENIKNGYHGWQYKEFVDSKEWIFCIVKGDGSLRTNVIYTK